MSITCQQLKFASWFKKKTTNEEVGEELAGRQSIVFNYFFRSISENVLVISKDL